MKKSWFYGFLLAHKKLYDLQIGYNKTAPLMRRYITAITRADKGFLCVIKRHFAHEITDRDLRILKIYQTEIERHTRPITTEFLQMMEKDFIDNKHGKENHFDSYLVHSYKLIKRAYIHSESSRVDKHIHLIVAFDAVTNTLHHSIDMCRHIAKLSPITGNMEKDAHIMNSIVKKELMSFDIDSAIGRLSDFLIA